MQPAPSVAVLKILSVSPFEEDHASLEAIVRHSTWALFKAHGLGMVLSVLAEHDISVIICERLVRPGTWTEVLEAVRDLPHPPSIIVTSRLVDDRLWAEVLNLGAWDVLVKPFERLEVVRSVKSAWQRWHDQIQAIPSGRIDVPSRAQRGSTGVDSSPAASPRPSDWEGPD
jgi:DNA-binding response OmpR family regulator